MLRVAREFVRNAFVHGHAQCVRVDIECDGRTPSSGGAAPFPPKTLTSIAPRPAATVRWAPLRDDHPFPNRGSRRTRWPPSLTSSRQSAVQRAAIVARQVTGAPTAFCDLDDRFDAREMTLSW